MRTAVDVAAVAEYTAGVERARAAYDAATTRGVCKKADCSSPSRARGMCHAHYVAHRRAAARKAEAS